MRSPRSMIREGGLWSNGAFGLLRLAVCDADRRRGGARPARRRHPHVVWPGQGRPEGRPYTRWSPLACSVATACGKMLVEHRARAPRGTPLHAMVAGGVLSRDGARKMLVENGDGRPEGRPYMRWSPLACSVATACGMMLVEHRRRAPRGAPLHAMVAAGVLSRDDVRGEVGRESATGAPRAAPTCDGVLPRRGYAPVGPSRSARDFSATRCSPLPSAAMSVAAAPRISNPRSRIMARSSSGRWPFAVR